MIEIYSMAKAMGFKRNMAGLVHGFSHVNEELTAHGFSHGDEERMTTINNLIPVTNNPWL